MARLCLMALLILVAGCSGAPAPTQAKEPEPEPKVTPPVQPDSKVQPERNIDEPIPETDARMKFKDWNLAFEPPSRPWVRDEDMRAKLGSPFILVYKREPTEAFVALLGSPYIIISNRVKPEAYMAIGARDYYIYSPRQSELRDSLSGALNKILETDTRKEYTDKVEKLWMGQQALGFRFSGVLKGGGNVEGDALSTSYKGVGYWLLSWAASHNENKAEKPALADARKRSILLELRQDWKEKKAPVVAFKNNVIPYTILDGEGIWEEVTDKARIIAEDTKADKYLITKKNRKRDVHDQAELIVLVLEGKANPLAGARKYIEAQANLMPEIRGKNTFTEQTGKLEGDPIPTINTVDGDAEHVFLKSVNSLDPAQCWLYAISAIQVGDRTVAVYAKCKWSDRAAFDTKFVQIVKSLREK